MKDINEIDSNDNSTLDSLIEGFQLIGFDWRYLYVNKSVVDHSKLKTKKDLLGFTMMEKFPGIDNTEMFKVLQECMNSRISKIIENKFTFPDGSVGWFELRIEPVPKGIFILSINITERKRIKADLLRSLEIFNFATLASNEIIYDWHINDNKIWWNDSYYKLICVENENKQLTLDSWTKFIHPEDHDQLLKSVTDFIEGKEDYWNGEYRFIGKNNDIHYLSDRGYLIRDDMGKPLRMIGAITDISSWKENIKNLEDILFSISHKVRQPVANILGISNLLNNELIDINRLKEIANHMRESADSLDKFIKELNDHVWSSKQKVENKNWA
jgi:PAS domain-containing protein